mmetsp:Transcript_29378/g.78620  ORF Transcript_29378/g.78620 Transcript_29378/m.78620 type:complete len:293 (-) Transcript_29378:39-917(-)
MMSTQLGTALLAVLIVVFLVLMTLSDSMRQSTLPSVLTNLSVPRHAQQNDEHQLFAGCSHIFLDVGSNRGTHVRKLFEPQKYPNAKYHALFDQGFGAQEWRRRPSAETGICAFGFEANPRWTSTLQKLEVAYARQGWRAKWFVPAAVSNKRGNVTMWLNDEGRSNDWGASAIVHSNKNAKGVSVPSVNLTDFMVQLNRSARSGYRLMKMDIESAEYIVLPPLVEKQLLCKHVLDMLTIEWHGAVRGKWPRNLKDDVKRNVRSADKCSSGPSTELKELDDESYVNDGMPLPGE